LLVMQECEMLNVSSCNFLLSSLLSSDPINKTSAIEVNCKLFEQYGDWRRLQLFIPFCSVALHSQLVHKINVQGRLPPKPMMHVAYSPYFSKIYIFSSLFSFFFVFWLLPILWPWCFYALCFTHSERPCKCVFCLVVGFRLRVDSANCVSVFTSSSSINHCIYRPSIGRHQMR